MADLGSGSQGQQSEGFEDIMARFFQPDGAEEAGGGQEEEASLATAIQEVAERPSDTELHTRLADQFQELRDGVAEALGEDGVAVVDSLVVLFRQMANFDIRLHRVMYQELEEAARALESLFQGAETETDLADLNQRLRRHLYQEPGSEEVVGGDEAADEPGEEMEQSILQGLQTLQQNPEDGAAMERVGALLDEISEELTGGQETLALRMGDVLSSYAEGELAWNDTIADALVRAGRVLANQQDPQPAVEELESLLQGGGGEEEGTGGTSGGEGGLSEALETLVQSPSDAERLQEAVSAADAQLSVAEAGPPEELTSQLKALFEALARFDIRLHKVMVEDLRAAVGALEADEQSQKDAAARVARYLPGAAEEGAGAAEPEPAAEEAEVAQESEPEPEPEPEPEAAGESADGEGGGQEEAGPRADRARPEEIEIPEGLDQLPEDSDPDLVSAFVEESREGLEDLDQTFMSLEEHPEDENLLHGAFRNIHTIKGTAGFIGLSRLQTLAHTMESVMDRVRNFEIALNASMMDDLLAGTDKIRQVVESVAGGGGDNVEVEDLIQRMAYYLDPNYKGEAPPKPKAGGEEAEAQGGGETASGSESSEEGEPQAASQGKQPAEQQGGSQKEGGGDQEGGSREAQSLRVPLERIDRLFNLAGELVLTRNQTRELAKKVADKLDDDRLAEDLAEEAHRLDLVTSDLQSAVMQTRMHSMATTFNKFKRVVRDLARKTNKQIQLHISGEQTELDRNVIESIQDPLVHLIRNSVDHGIEEPEEREAKGKPRSGRLDLRAYYEENFVVIEVADDGAGLNSDKLRNKAVSRGVIEESEAQQMSDREAQQLIFMAGFSSVDQVSDISGRGVGMDVVRTNVEDLKGSIQVDSAVDEGTTIKIRLPLTLSIQQTLIVQIGPEHFAIPLETVKETLDYDSSKVTSVRGQRVYQRADEILPILQMTELFGMSRVHDAHAHYLVVLEMGMQRAGILVDRIVGKEEAVMKSLEALKGIYEPDYFAGASVRGDGRISLVVDVGRLFANVATMRGHARAREAAEQDEVQVETHPYLVLDGGGNELFALARESVHDIELVNVSEVQWMNGHEYINREQRAMPIVRLSSITGEAFRHPGEEAYVVYTDDGRGRRSMGILVNHLHGIQQLYHDETAETLEVEGAWDTALWEGRVVAILDLPRIQDATKHKVPDDLAAGA